MANWISEAEIRIKSIESNNAQAQDTLVRICMHYDGLCANIKRNLGVYYNNELSKVLNQIDIKEINQNKDGIRVSLLENAGYTNLKQLNDAPPHRIEMISGIGTESVSKIYRNLKAIEDTVSKSIFIRFDPDKKDEFHSKLLNDLFIMRHGQEISSRASNAKQAAFSQGYTERLKQLRKKPKLFLRLFWSNSKVEDYQKNIEDIGAEIQNNLVLVAAELDQSYIRVNNAAVTCWDDFMANAAAYYGLIEQLWPVKRSVSVPGMDGDSEIKALMDEIDGMNLHLSLMKTDLRNYQLFGTKYIISQNRVLIGDEMGLGKTIQAIAAMAHLKSEGASVFVVVCPLSILANWEREIEKHSYIQADVLHGNAIERVRQYRAWIGSGRIAVTTYDQVGKLPFEELDHIDMLIVDEAHNVKNPSAQRTGYVRQLVSRSNRVVYMTGTPLENKLDEMRFLIGSINPVVGQSISGKGIVVNSTAFRKSIAPVYLRRVREDVLKELPELLEIEDWLTMNETEEKKYEQTLVSRNYMDVRRLSWNVPVANSSKAQKLKEICDEAKDDNRKILIFSFFISTIDMVSHVLGDMCIGRITGEVPVADRQRIIDKFTNAPTGSALVCQINTGGTGLNIQAASVVIFCEPQWKPSIEDQALSRSYRMGQARSVMVHRLLAANTIDEYMMQTLQRKKDIFNEYAEESVIGNANQEQSEMNAMMAYIEEEIQKRGLTDGKLNMLSESSESASDGLTADTPVVGVESGVCISIPVGISAADFSDAITPISGSEVYASSETADDTASASSLKFDKYSEPQDIVKESNKEPAKLQERYPWEKFYPDHCNDRNVDDMRVEGIRLVADGYVSDQDLLDAVCELSNMENRIKVFDDILTSGFCITEYFVVEYFESEGDDVLVQRALAFYMGRFSARTVMKFVSAGLEGETFAFIINKCEEHFSFSQIVDMVEYVSNIKPETFRKVIDSVAGIPTYDQLAEILDCIDDNLYKYVEPYLKRLPFDQRVELRDSYGL